MSIYKRICAAGLARPNQQRFRRSAAVLKASRSNVRNTVSRGHPGDFSLATLLRLVFDSRAPEFEEFCLQLFKNEDVAWPPIDC